ncbi:metal ABC transporter solute-binding protein, Zn/Mn family [uncultured Rikenella sp.]|uniref:metal ABC transporter solute-binding protein, Zn/Mn family n=1 Tax=uncultured Rikenella sp. TaxID=368003 RepID=UPI00272986CE|nr:zinc ABC transporter substrate-binding protein [uncultured Rikenella sp.]
MNRIILSFLLFTTSCTTSFKPKNQSIFVSIVPLKYIVEQIVAPGSSVEVLAPETASPESYEPTVRQIQALADARAYITTGLIDFEQTLLEKIPEAAPKTPVCNVSQPIELLHIAQSEKHAHGGIDPHIWLSPRRVAVIGKEVADFLGKLEPDSAAIYRQRAEIFAVRIDTLDHRFQRVAQKAKRKQFAIGHTALTYFADDYGLQQIAVEADGKEPSVMNIKQLVDSLQKADIRTVFFQPQTSDAATQAIVRELPNGRAIEFDPLAAEWMDNMSRLADSLQVILNE